MKRLREITWSAVVAIALSLTPAAQSAAPVLSETPLTSYQFITSPVDTYPVNADGRVNAISFIGSDVFIGGNFQKVMNHSGTQTTRNHLAALDKATGATLRSWNPNANGNVNALAVAPDNSSLFVGGEFTIIGGVSRNRLAAVDPSTGAVQSKLNISVTGGSIDCIAVTSAGALFIGGDFTTVDGQSRTHLAKLVLQSGSYVLDDTWTPNANGGAVRAISLYEAGNRVVVGGAFTSIDGATTQKYIACLNTSTGAVMSWATHTGRVVIDMCVDGTKLFVACDGAGGRVFAFNVTNGNQLWFYQTDGDCQAVTVIGGYPIFGMHGNYVAPNPNQDMDEYGTSERIERDKVFMCNPDTGVLQAWNPKVHSGSNFLPLGLWCAGTDSGNLYMGGDFSDVSSVAQERFAILTGSGGDTNSPGEVMNLQAVPGDGQVTLSWTNPTDSDFAGVRVRYSTTGYVIDGATGGSGIYNGTGTTFTHTGLTNGTTYYYTLFTKDEVPNWSSGANIAAKAGGDVTAPGPITNFTCVPGDSGELQLSWTNPTASDFDRVQIQRKTGSYPTSRTDGTTAYVGPGTSLLDSGLTNGTMYYYKAWTCDEVPNWSTSAQVSGTPLADTTPPANVTNVQAVPGDRQVTLTWTNPRDADFTGVRVRYSTSGYVSDGAEGGGGIYNGTGTSFTHSNRTNGVTYYYTIFTQDEVPNWSNGINIAAAPVDTTPPGAVTNLSASVSTSDVTLSWTNPTASDFTGVKVVRKNGSYPTGPADGTVIYDGAATSCSTNLPAAWVNYYYGAYAYDDEATPNYATPAQLIGSTLESSAQAANDGWVCQDGTFNNNDIEPWDLKCGDTTANKQMKPIVSIATGTTLTGKTLLSASLRMTCSQVYNTNPFTDAAFGTLKIDIRNGGFNGNVALEAADYSATASASNVGVAGMTNPGAVGGVSAAVLNSTGLSNINKTSGGVTQFRLYFNGATNNNNRGDQVDFYSGENATGTNRPQLTVYYK